MSILELFLSAFATMSRVSPTPPAPMSGDLPLLYTLRIILRLRALRTSLGLSACPPRPPLHDDEFFLGLSIYPGSMTEVTSQDDRDFGSLGRLFFILQIEKRLDGGAIRKRAVFDDGRIPRHILASDQELNELLVLHNSSIAAPPSSLLRSSAVVADTFTHGSASSSNDSQVQDASPEVEIEVSEPCSPSRRSLPNGRAERKHAPYYIPRRSHDAHLMSKGITVTILAWTKETYRQIPTTLKIGNGQCMTLSMVATSLAELFEGCVDSSNLERLKGREIDFRQIPNFIMPKVTSTSKSSYPSTPASALKQQYTKKIVARLMAIRTSRSMSMYPPEPLINPARESIVRKGVFNGSTREVNSPLHPDFGKLGTIFWVIEKNGPVVEKGIEEDVPPAEKDVEEDSPPVRKSIVYDTASIPIEVLFADQALMQYLDMRS
ncbi:hypothetical protein EV360DRAFT_68412 [Lentinula raphanica]|nr:hypothetical protein EV360DRAFT_68412 [Lentinula raphanica]